MFPGTGEPVEGTVVVQRGRPLDDSVQSANSVARCGFNLLPLLYRDTRPTNMAIRWRRQRKESPRRSKRRETKNLGLLTFSSRPKPSKASLQVWEMPSTKWQTARLKRSCSMLRAGWTGCGEGILSHRRSSQSRKAETNANPKGRRPLGPALELGSEVFQYTGKLPDATTGLYYDGARYHNSTTGGCGVGNAALSVLSRFGMRATPVNYEWWNYLQ